ATQTEIYDYLRVLFARIGHPHCLICNREIKKLSNEEILETVFESINHIKTEEHGTKVMGVPVDKAKVRIYSPVVVGRKGEYYQMLYDYLGKGYETVKIDGVAKKLRERIELEKNKKHDIDILIDEFYISEFKNDPKGVRERLAEAIERSVTESGGLLKIETPGKDAPQEKLMSVKFMCPYDGFSYPEIEPRLFSFNSPYGACPECNGLGTRHFFGDEVCPKCNGARLREEALHVFFGGAPDAGGLNIKDLVGLSIKNSREFFEKLKLSPKDKEIAKVILKEIESRLDFMINVGIEYLTLDRRAHTLSGGEAQRIRLASQLGSGLVGALYVLDEPTIGLHSRDNNRLIKTLLHLRDIGNTIIVVEHDEETIFSSDYIVDIGPGAGVHGGKIVVSGYLEKLLGAKKNDSKSVTLDYLRGEKAIEVPEHRRDKDKGSIKIRGGKIFNIKNLHVDIPLGRLVGVTGVSGSGKSSLLYEILHKNLQARFERRYRSNEVFNCASFTGSEYLSRAILIDQSPI
ncbi:MAG: hypothetical protein Q7T18_04280, partial [Sedimentisphaerales bacterium]|nr:hypothetical protein [Sedimentisphaerales bacterium]